MSAQSLLTLPNAVRRDNTAVEGIRTTENYLSAVDHRMAMKATKQAVRTLVEEFGYSLVTLEPDFRDEEGKPNWTGCRDYRAGPRKPSFVQRRRTSPAYPPRYGRRRQDFLMTTTYFSSLVIRIYHPVGATIWGSKTASNPRSRVRPHAQPLRGLA